MAFFPSRTKWVKMGRIPKISFVGKEAVCYGGGCFIQFCNLISSEEHLYAANTREQGEGVRCYIGHRVLPIFAFAETCANPNVYVHTYPDFVRICTLSGGSVIGYTKMVFTDTSFLITVGDMPNYFVTIWNWRNGGKITTFKTDIIVSSQMLKASLGRPIFVSQLSVNTTCMNIWDILMCGSRCTLVKHAVRSEPGTPVFVSTTWNAEGACFLLDELGNVYTVNSEHKTEMIVEAKERGTNISSFTWFKGGIVVVGTDNELRQYKKSGSWNLSNSMTPPENIYNITSNGRELLIGTSMTGNFILFDLESLTYTYAKKDESNLRDFCVVYPTGTCVVTLSYDNHLTLWNTEEGCKRFGVKVERNALVLESNPDFPYIGVGYDDGVLELFSVNEPEGIQSLVTFQLTRNPINSLHFTEISRTIVAADLRVGQFFIIEGIPGAKMHVVGTVEVKHQIADYILVASRTCYRLFVLLVTSDQYIAGDRILRYCVIKGRPHSDMKEYELEEPKQMYSQLKATLEPDRDRVFLAIPFRSREIHTLETKRAEPGAKLVNKVNTGHQMCKISLFTHQDKLLSFGFDGLVIKHSRTTFIMKGVIMPHHRRDGGVIKAYITPLKKYIVSMGRDNNIVCTELTDVVVDQEKEQELLDLMQSDKFLWMFTHPTYGFTLKGEYDGKTWFEVAAMRRKDKESEICAAERLSILQEFHAIQREIKKLLTKNLEGPENERISIQEFNLETNYVEHQRIRSLARCRQARLYLEALIEAQNKVSKWCKEYFWDSMFVQGKSIWAIFGSFDVQNYVLLHDCDIKSDALRKIEQQRRTEELMAKYDRFRPWVPASASELEEQIKTAPSLAKPDEGPDITVDLDEEEEKEKEAIETVMAKTGSVACNFVELNPWHYSQEDISTFWQTQLHTALALLENKKLKEYFNKEFEFMYTQKQREMVNVKERYARLRHIISEINYFSTNKLSIILDDPEWRQSEIPELIVKVDDKEVGITPYISPSEQAILDAKAAEEERIRLLLLADDFRERALMKMMNGVLEVRWEDELKKDVPIPKCMIEKEPEQFNEEDLRAVRDYEEKVAFLQSERERYLNLLYAEYAKLSYITREGMRKFNERLSDLLQVKMSVDAGLIHQNLSVNKCRYLMHRKNQFREQEEEIISNLKANDRKIEETQRTLNVLHQFLQECKSTLEHLQTKEKTLEKACKKDFAELSLVVQDAISKLYKRRPKFSFRNITQSTLLYELARCLVTQERTVVIKLSNESLEYLSAVDNVDQFLGIPNIIDERTYISVCKHRRLKIENEIKIKAASVDLTEAEQTIARFRERLVQKKHMKVGLNEELVKLRQSKLKMVENFEVQLALRQGFVEVQTTGQMSDFDDAILVCRSTVESINKIIVSAGDRKLAAMQEMINFQKQIKATEWEHERLKMRIQDLQEQLADLFSVKMTKEIQGFLKSRAKGEQPDKGMTFEQEVDMMKEGYEQILEEKRTKIKDLQKQLDIFKKENKILDQRIEALNVDVCEFKLNKDEQMEKVEEYIMKDRIATLQKRARYIKQIQENHKEILVLQTELELLRLKTYPTLKYKILI